MKANQALELPAARARRDWLVLGLGLTPFAAAIGGLASVPLHHSLVAVMAAPFLMILGVMTTSRARTARPRLTPGTLRIDDEDVTFAGERIARRRDVERLTYHLERGVGAIARLHLDGAPDARFVLDDADAARDLQRALGFGADRSTARFVGKSLVRGLDEWVQSAMFFAMVVLTGIGAIGIQSLTGAPEAILGMLVLGALCAVTSAFAPTTVEVGADALAIRWLGRRTQLVPMPELDRVEPTALEERAKRSGELIVHHGVRIHIRGRNPVAIRFGSSAHDLAQRNQLIERIHEVRDARDGTDRVLDTAFLARGQRDVATWIAALRAGGSSEGGPRAAPIPPERLWSLVEDPSADALDRAAAAVAVARTATAAERERVRIAAKQSIDPDLRAALERAAEDEADDEAIAAALEELEARRHA